ncbi:MAG: ScyD/ScyE family protein [Bacteroidota bacterium]
MKNSSLSSSLYGKINKGDILHIFIFCLAFLVVACTDNGVTPTEDPSVYDELASSLEISPQTILSSENFANLTGMTNAYKSKSFQASSENGFASPLFGLATAPNGDILVADAGAGIATLDGTTEISLPGISDMSPIGRSAMWALEGLTGEPGEDTGQALYRTSKGNSNMIVDLFEFEKAYNPDGEDFIDSNPFDVQSLGGNAALVVDAGGNDLLKIDNKGNVEVVAVFPNELVSTANVKELVGCPESGADLCGLPNMIPTQSVPTSIAIGPDGYFYVGELKGFPAPTNVSNIWRISPDASGAMCGSSPDCEKVFDGGFTSIIDLAFDSYGNLHVAEIDEQSWFAVEILGPADLVGGTINSCNLGTTSCSEVATNIPILTAITFGKDGTLWATKNALIPGLAEVIEVN